MVALASICEETMRCEETARKGNEWAMMLRDELSWQDGVEEGTLSTCSEGSAGVEGDGGFGARGLVAADDALRAVLEKLVDFDKTCGAVRSATDKPGASGHAARRGKMCKELEKPVSACLEEQEMRYEQLRTRAERLRVASSRMQEKVLHVVAEPTEATDNVPGGPLDLPLPEIPPLTEASRTRLRSALDQALTDFTSAFNVVPDAVSVLGEPILERLVTLRTMATDDASVVTTLLVRGRAISEAESAEIEQAVSTRDVARTDLQIGLVDELQKARAIVVAFVQAARLHLEFEWLRISGDDDCDKDNAAGSVGAGGLMDAKSALKLVDDGKTANAKGLESVIGLLRERLAELKRLPPLEKEARKLWRRVKRAEKTVVRIHVMKRAWQNRHDEAMEYADISSESSDDDLDDDEDFDVHNPEEVQARIEQLTIKQGEKGQFAADGRVRLAELAVALPELKFELQEPVRALQE